MMATEKALFERPILPGLKIIGKIDLSNHEKDSKKDSKSKKEKKKNRKKGKFVPHKSSFKLRDGARIIKAT